MDQLAARRALRDHVAELWRACACKDCTMYREAREAGEGERWWDDPRILTVDEAKRTEDLAQMFKALAKTWGLKP